MAVTDEIDWDEFCTSLLSPRRPLIDEARASATALARERRPRRPRAASRDPAPLLTPGFLDEAWERLTTRFDAPELLGDPRRGFLPFYPIEHLARMSSMPGGADQYSLAKPEYLAERPNELEGMVAMLAAERADLLRAEDLALEACDRFTKAFYDRPVGGGKPWAPMARVLWALLPEAWPREGYRRQPLTAVESQLLVGATDEPDSEREADRLYNTVCGYWPPANIQTQLPTYTTSAAHDARCWRMWASRRTTPNPFEPLLMIWGLGYGVVRLMREGIVLGLPWGLRDGPAVTAPNLRAVAEAEASAMGRGGIFEWP